MPTWIAFVLCLLLFIWKACAPPDNITPTDIYNLVCLGGMFVALIGICVEANHSSLMRKP